jgi:pimeloyl-ACP methyl ester carboxylesterase
MAGVVLSELAERHPEKVKKLVYVAAYLLADGETIFQHAMSDAGSVLGPHLRPDEAKGILSVAPEGYEAALASGCSAEDVTLVREKARSEPLAPLATPIHVSAERFGRVPRLFVHTLSDRAVSTTLQAKLLIATPTETVTLASGHSPFFSHAAELSALLARAAG